MSVDTRPPAVTTRLAEIQKRFDSSFYVDNFAESDIEWLAAEVSRLREERDSWQRLANQSSAKHCSVAEQLGDLTDERDDLKVEVSRLQQENALLRRSLEMLTKQLDEKDERIDELVGLIGEVD